MAYPSTLSSLANPAPTDRLNNPSHSTLHDDENAGIIELQTFIGTLPASAVGTLIYDIRSPDSNGGGHVQSANKGGTGQTLYTKGDLLVATSTSVLTKLAVGVDNTVLVANSSVAAGVNWGAAPTILVSSTVALSSVWTKPAAAGPGSQVFVQLWGAGGSGAATVAANEAGGGGGGGYAYGWFPASILSSSVLLGIGKGGDSISNSGAGPGIAGGITVFDTQSSLLTAYGGGGGGNAATGGGGGGGGGGTASGSTANGAAGGGGGSVFGADGGSGASVLLGYFGGGGGFVGNNAATAFRGGNAIYGGAGGGAASSSVAGLAGTSQLGGAGGAASILSVGSAFGGSTPGGGGGAGHGAGGSSGQGGAGKAIITVFL